MKKQFLKLYLWWPVYSLLFSQGLWIIPMILFPFIVLILYVKLSPTALSLSESVTGEMISLIWASILVNLLNEKKWIFKELGEKYHRAVQKVSLRKKDVRNFYTEQIQSLVTTENSITIHSGSPFEIIIKMRADPGKYKYIPPIMINGYEVSKQITSTHIIADISRIIEKNQEEFSIVIGKNAPLQFSNPYYFNKDLLEKATIRFQCEGHNDEKKIEIRFNTKTSFTSACSYIFLLYIDKLLVFKGQRGTYDEETNSISIPLPTIKKEMVRGKAVSIRLKYCSLIRCTLPEPEIIFHR